MTVADWGKTRANLAIAKVQRAQLTLGSVTYRPTGAFNGERKFKAVAAVRGQPSANFDLAYDPFTKSIVGTVTVGAKTINIAAARQYRVAKGAVASYTMVLRALTSSTNGEIPTGTGYATAVVNKGTGLVTVNGVLGDGATTIKSKTLLKSDGSFPLFATFVKQTKATKGTKAVRGLGALVGEMQIDPSTANTDDDGRATMDWYSPLGSAGYNASAFTTPVDALLSAYTAPTVYGLKDFSKSGAFNATISFVPDDSDTPILKRDVVYNPTLGRVIPLKGEVNPVSLSITKTTGRVTGAFQAGVAPSIKTYRFEGVVFSQTNTIEGWFIHTKTGKARGTLKGGRFTFERKQP